MAKLSKSTRKFPRLEPCNLGKQLAQIIGDGAVRVARRKALATRLGVSPGYLHFLATGEPNNDGSPMKPSDVLAAKFRDVLAELGGLKKAGTALDVGSFQAALTDSAPTAAPAAPKATKPQARASKRSKASTKRKTAPKKSRKARKGAK